METTDDYAAAAPVYSEADTLPIRVYAELPTVFGVLGPIEGAEVLDLACGAGIYTRMLVERGARRAVGVDLSPAMIEQARTLTPQDAPIEYRVGDAGSIDDLGLFDVVTAAFLLNYASSRDELAAFCRAIAARLRPGGRFVGTVPSSNHRSDPSFGPRYGAHYPWPDGIGDGDPYTFELHLSSVLHIDTYFWTNETYGRELEGAGLTDFVCQPWLPDEEGLRELGHDFWAPWRANPMIAVVSARRP